MGSRPYREGLEAKALKDELNKGIDLYDLKAKAPWPHTLQSGTILLYRV